MLFVVVIPPTLYRIPNEDSDITYFQVGCWAHILAATQASGTGAAAPES